MFQIWQAEFNFQERGLTDGEEVLYVSIGEKTESLHIFGTQRVYLTLYPFCSYYCSICPESVKVIRIWGFGKEDVVPLDGGNESSLHFKSMAYNLTLRKIQDALIITPNFGEIIVQVETIEDWQNIAYLEDTETFEEKVESDSFGILSLEIVAGKNLPKANKMLQALRVLHPFAVVSFGRQTFRTRVARNTLNPVWKENATL